MRRLPLSWSSEEGVAPIVTENLKKRKRIVLLTVFLFYIVALCYFLFFAEMFGRAQAGGDYQYNLVLFKEIKRFWNYREQLGIFAVTANLLGNVVGFLPYGYFLPVLWKKTDYFMSALLLTFSLSLAIETIQLYFKVGSFDVDDLFLNTLGGLLGFFIYRISRERK